MFRLLWGLTKISYDQPYENQLIIQTERINELLPQGSCFAGNTFKNLNFKNETSKWKKTLLSLRWHCYTPYRKPQLFSSMRFSTFIYCCNHPNTTQVSVSEFAISQVRNGIKNSYFQQVSKCCSCHWPRDGNVSPAPLNNVFLIFHNQRTIKTCINLLSEDTISYLLNSAV